MSTGICHGCGGEVENGECPYCGMSVNHSLEAAGNPEPAESAGVMQEPDDPMLLPYWNQYQQAKTILKEGEGLEKMEALYKKIVSLREQHQDDAAFMTQFQQSGLLQEYMATTTGVMTSHFMPKTDGS